MLLTILVITSYCVNKTDTISIGAPVSTMAYTPGMRDATLNNNVTS